MEQGISQKTFNYRLRKIREATLAVKEKHEIVSVQQPVITAKLAKQDSQKSIKISANGIVAELPKNISSELITAAIHSCGNAEGVQFIADLHSLQINRYEAVYRGLAAIVKQNFGLYPCPEACFCRQAPC